MLWFPKLSEEETDWSDTVGPIENLRHCYSHFLLSFCCVLALQYLIFTGYDAGSSSIPGFYTSNNFFHLFFPVKSVHHYVFCHVRNA